ncbi:MAG: Lin0512 family protein [Nitratireductor sp.]
MSDNIKSDNTKQLKRIILEMGTGNDLYGEDYTKAAKRAVQDAIHHSSIQLFKTLDIDPNLMEIELNLAAQKPDEIDLEEVAKTLPYGKVTPKGIEGGLNVYDEVTKRTSVIVNAGIIVRLWL